MTTPNPVTPPSHSHGSSLSLTKKLGPIPLYGWVAIVVGVAIAYRVYQQRSGSASTTDLADASLANSGASAGLGGFAPVSGGSGSSGSGTVTIGPSGATDNADWGQKVVTSLISTGTDPTLANNAIQKYLNGQQLTPEEANVVQQAIAKYSPPPQGLLPINTLPVPTTPTPTGPTYSVYKPPPGTTYVRNAATGEIDQVWPDGTTTHLSPLQYAALGNPKFTQFGSAPASSKPAPAPAPKPAPAPAPKPAPKPASRTYVVQRGDTLSSISSHFYGTSSKWSTIYNANKGVIGSNPNLIKPGQRLVIP